MSFKGELSHLLRCWKISSDLKMLGTVRVMELWPHTMTEAMTAVVPNPA